MGCRIGHKRARVYDRPRAGAMNMLDADGHYKGETDPVRIEPFCRPVDRPVHYGRTSRTIRGV